MYAAIAKASWYAQIFLDATTLAEIAFWRDNYNFSSGYTLKLRPVTSKMLFTVASEDGYGGFLVKRGGHAVVAGKFGILDLATSSPPRTRVGQVRLTVVTDNFPASRILDVGSSKSQLQRLALDIFQICLRNNVRIIPQWFPREANSIADYYSKLSDIDNWSIDSHSFAIVNQKYGPYSIDRFADNLNTKVDKFNSKHFCPGTSGLNAFTEDWTKENNWICPTVSLLGSVFRHLRRCNARLP